MSTSGRSAVQRCVKTPTVLRGGEPCGLLRTFLPIVLIGGCAFKIQAYRVGTMGTRHHALQRYLKLT